MGRLADAFRQLNVPVIVVACKTDLEAAVSLSDVEAVVRRYDAGIIQTSIVEESGKERIREAFRFLFARLNSRTGMRRYHTTFESSVAHGAIAPDEYQGNPASPKVISSASPPPWEISRASSATPTGSSSHPRDSFQQSSPTNRTSGHTPSQSISHATRPYHMPLTNAASSPTPTPASPTRARSTNDLLSEHEKSKREERDGHTTVYNTGRNSSHASLQAHVGTGLGLDGPSSTTDVSTSDGARDLSMKES